MQLVIGLYAFRIFNVTQLNAQTGVTMQTFDSNYMPPKLLLKLHRNREVRQCICQLVQSIYGRMDAFETADLLPNR